MAANFIDSSFKNTREAIDGKTYQGCRFEGTQLIFAASAPATFTECTFDNVTWAFEGSAGLTLAFIYALMRDHPDYGRDILVSTFPALEEWIKPEIVEKRRAARRFPSKL